MRKVGVRKITLITAISWGLFYFMQNSQRFNELLFISSQEATPRKFALFLILSIIKYFIIILSVVSTTILLQQIYKKKK